MKLSVGSDDRTPPLRREQPAPSVAHLVPIETPVHTQKVHFRNAITTFRWPAFLIGTMLLTNQPLLRAQETAISWASEGLSGRVRTLTESEVANASAQNPNGNAFQTRVVSFSTGGFAWEVRKFGADTERTTFILQGPLVVRSYTDSPDGDSREVSYSRDATGQVQENVESIGTVLTFTTRFEDKPPDKEIIEYCNDQPSTRLLKATDENSPTSTVSSFEYSDDRKDWALVSRYKQGQTKLPNGSVRTESVGACSTIMTIDANQKLLEDIQDCPRSYHRETHRYNELGWEIEKAEWERNNEPVNRRTYLYATDSHGNWIRKREMFWSPAYREPVEGELTLRRIEYY